MREIVATTGNLMLGDDGDGNWQSQAELVIVTSEVQYHLDEDFEVKKRRRNCDAFRVLVTEKSITCLIEGLEKLRYEMQNQTTAAINANLERKAA